MPANPSPRPQRKTKTPSPKPLGSTWRLGAAGATFGLLVVAGLVWGCRTPEPPAGTVAIALAGAPAPAKAPRTPASRPAEGAPPERAATDGRIRGRLVTVGEEPGWLLVTPTAPRSRSAEPSTDDPALRAVFAAAQELTWSCTGRTKDGGWTQPGGKGVIAVGPDGRFDLALPPGAYDVLAGARRHATTHLAVTLGPGEELMVPLEHLGEATLALSVTAGGLPLPSQRLVVVARQASGFEASTTLVTDRLGLARWTLAGGDWQVHAERASGQSAPVSWSARAGQVVPCALAFDGPAALSALSVLVVDPAGHRVPGALVDLVAARPGASSRRLTSLVPLDGRDLRTTDADGRVELVPTTEGVYFVAARDGRAATEPRGGRSPALLVPGAGPEVRVVLDEPLGRGHVTVRLFRGAGEEAPYLLSHGVEVRLRTSRGTDIFAAGDDGASALELADLAPGRTEITVTVDEGASALEPATAVVDVQAGRTTVADLHLEPAEALHVQLLQPDGRPFEGQLLLVLPDGSIDRMRLQPMNRIGCVSTRRVRRGERYGLIAEGDGWAPTLLEARLSPGPDKVQLRLPDAPLRTLEVLERGGGPAAEVTLRFHLEPGRPLFVTDRDGRLTLRATQAPSLVVIEGREHERFVGPPVVGPGGTLGVTLVRRAKAHDQSATLRCRVVDETGAPVVGAHVAVAALGTVLSSGATTARDGSWSYDRFPAGPVSVLAWRADLGQAVPAPVVLPTTEPFTLVLRRGAPQVRGRVVGAGHTVQLLDADGRETLAVAEVRHDGSFDLGPVAPGRWQLALLSARAEEPALVVARQPLEVRAGAPMTVELRAP